MSMRQKFAEDWSVQNQLCTYPPPAGNARFETRAETKRLAIYLPERQFRGEVMRCPDPCPSCQCTLSYAVLRAVLRCLMLSDVLFVVPYAVLCCPMMLSCAVLHAHWWSVLAVLPSLWYTNRWDI